MEENILHKLAEVEKEVQQRLDVEKEKSRRRLEKVREDAEKEIIALKKTLAESLEKEINNIKLNSEKKASEVLENARARSELLGRYDDDRLKKIILKHITGILP